MREEERSERENKVHMRERKREGRETERKRERVSEGRVR